MMKNTFYMLLYFLTIAIHYLGATYLIIFVKDKYNLSWLKISIIWFIVWFSVGILCSGCPFSYLQDWLAYKAWGCERSYNFSQSMVHKLIIKHF